MVARALAQLDLNLLHTLHEVARCGSVTAAAKNLQRTQPAISSRLHQLETQLGVKLFERAGRNLQLSPIGRLVRDEAHRAMEGLEGILDHVQASTSQPVGVLRIGALPTLCAYLLAPVVVRLSKTYPSVSIQLAPSLSAGQADLVRGGELDVLVSVGRILDTRLHVDVVGEIDACVAMPLSRPARRGRMSVAELARHDYVSYGRLGDPFFDEVANFLEKTGLSKKVRIEVSHIQAIKQLILEGGGVSILPKYTVVEPGLAAHRLQGFDFRLPLCVAMRRTSRPLPVLQQFNRFIAARMADVKREPRR